MTMGNKIQLCRKKAGLSQEALATALGISRQAVSRWETGEAVPDTERVIQLSRLFHVTTDYLLLDEVDVSAPEASAPVASPETAPTNDHALQERRQQIRIFFAKFTLFGGLVMIIATLIGAGAYANALTSWVTRLGRYGTALLESWLIYALFVSVCVFVTGIVLLIVEYRRND